MSGAWAVIALLLAQQTPIDTLQDAGDVAELTRLEGVWNEAHLRGGAEALDRLWADDLVVTVPGMRVLTKADALAIIASGHMRFERYETADVRVRVHGDSAITTGRLRRTRRIGGKSVEDDWQFTKSYIRSDGAWRVVAFHASEAPQ